ncbi:MAG: SDR family oxidoreductase [Ignavibacteria bacterium]|nr:SDR family oxidoreductase [Ignavibacteria bacterium]
MNKTVIITGGTSGVGKSLAYKLAESGCSVIIFARYEVKANNTVNEIISRTGNKEVKYILCDFAVKDSILNASEVFKRTYSRLDVLVNNAGTTIPRMELTSDGIEKTFAVNHLGYFFLTYLLKDILVNSAPSRIINVASQAHIKIDFNNLNGEKSYDQYKAYGYSKTANILFTYELSKRLRDRNVTVNCVHPGVVDTAIYDNVPGIMRLIIRLMSVFFLSPDKSAERIIPLILSEKYGNITGKYFINLEEKMPKVGTYENEDSIRLWDLSNIFMKTNF